MNAYAEYIDKRIADIVRSDRWNNITIICSHDDFVKNFGTNVFTNLIRSTFTKSYMKHHQCIECGDNSTDRCHGESRLSILRKALLKTNPDETQPVNFKDVVITFLDLHKYTSFNFKCKQCHKNETRRERITS
jgi:hypothetical protein